MKTRVIQDDLDEPTDKGTAWEPPATPCGEELTC